jgi:hypothetical protein
MLRLARVISSVREYAYVKRYQTSAAALVLFVMLALFAQFVTLLWRESQLVRREQAIDRLYEKTQEIGQLAEQTSRRIDQNLDRMQQYLDSMDANFNRMRQVSSQASTSDELPLELAPLR